MKKNHQNIGSRSLKVNDFTFANLFSSGFQLFFGLDGTEYSLKVMRFLCSQH